MAKLRADRRNYRKAFTTHANAYDIGMWEVIIAGVCYCAIV